MNDPTTASPPIAPETEEQQPAPRRTSALLYGSDQIAAHCNMSEGQAKPLVTAGIIPTFKMPGFDKPCGWIPEVDQRLEECWRYHRDGHPLKPLEEIFAQQRKRKSAAKAAADTRKAARGPKLS